MSPFKMPRSGFDGYAKCTSVNATATPCSDSSPGLSLPSIGMREVLSISSKTRVDAPSAWMTDTNVADIKNSPALLLIE